MINLSGWCLLLTPLKNDGVSSSVGMMTFHSQLNGKSFKIPKCSSHHQPDILLFQLLTIIDQSCPVTTNQK
jgi:hypothetical protein